MSYTWFVFEVMGTLAFALSGALVGLTAKMDIFGITVLAALTAVGGGMIRDVLIGVTPPLALSDSRWLLIAIVVAFIVSFAWRVRFHGTGRKVSIAFYNFCDTVGLAAFTVTGATLGLEKFPNNRCLLPIMLGLVTAVGGGILRDLLAQRVPSVLRVDFYAAAALCGAAALCAMWPRMDHGEAARLAFAVVVILRICAIRGGWHLYRPIR